MEKINIALSQKMDYPNNPELTFEFREEEAGHNWYVQKKI